MWETASILMTLWRRSSERTVEGASTKCTSASFGPCPQKIIRDTRPVHSTSTDLQQVFHSRSGPVRLVAWYAEIL
jgi:hypothetical protein